MPRDKKAEKAAEKKREELERKKDQEREEERRQHARDEEREFEQEEERRRQQAEAARLKAVERHHNEHRAQEKTQQRHQQREAERVQSRQQEQRDTAVAQGRAGERQAERDRERHESQRQGERQAQTAERQREDKQRTQAEQRAEERRTEQQTEARAAQRSEERDAQRTNERAAQQAQERADSRRAAAAEQQRQEKEAGARRQEQLTAERRQTQLAEAQAARKGDQAQADKAKTRADDQRRQQQAEDRASRKQEQVQADQAKARTEREAASGRRLQARLPSGHLSNGLPWLITSGNRIVSAEDASRPPQAVILRGVNRSGLEYSEPGIDFLNSARITRADLSEMASWGANIVRIPFNQDWALHGRRGHPATEYLDNLDQLIFWLSGLGAYSLLDLQWLDADTSYGTYPDGSTNRVAPLPNRDSITVWTLLATRYQNEPAVLYDVFNEPHAPLPDDPNPLARIGEDGTLVTVTTVTMEVWQSWARQLVAAIRRVHNKSLIFVSGIDWGYNLKDMPLRIVAGGPEVFASLVYSTHVYPGKGPKVATSTLPADIPTLASTDEFPNWARAFGRLAATVPVFAGEWGGDDADASPWGEGLAMYMSALGMGWTAWSWVDRPYLRQASLPSGLSVPTRFGHLVRHWLAMP
ncbi:MAG TPA: cellulase family glycosylhydrolase [Candidatus Nitrosopolaris sp.]|nr:cellulase family glycosylhydrolase [Candidatus Nitrosopolaris sp.]